MLPVFNCPVNTQLESKTKHDSGRITKSILAIIEAGRQPAGEGVEGIELSTEVVHLDCPKSKVPRYPDVNSATELHGESGPACDTG